MYALKLPVLTKINCNFSSSVTLPMEVCCNVVVFCSYLASSGADRKLKIYDLRTYGELHCHRLSAGAGRLDFSQRGLLAATLGNTVEVH